MIRYDHENNNILGIMVHRRVLIVILQFRLHTTAGPRASWKVTEIAKDKITVASFALFLCRI